MQRYPGRRDDFVGDIVGVCFDSYFDKRAGFEFDLTAGGGKIDLILGNESYDATWDAVWHGKVGLEEDAWTAEFQIPLSQLRYGPHEEQVWGLHAWRWIARNWEESQWNLIPRNNTGFIYNIGELHGIRGLPKNRRIELLPHVLGELDSAKFTADNQRERTIGSGSAGLDAKVGLSSNFTLDATVNPDFGQVEADPSVINLTAYETFFEEKRPFFLEGKRILDFALAEGEGSFAIPLGEADTSFGEGGGPGDILYYSRRIGARPSLVPELSEGEFTGSPPAATTILTALKISGKTRDGLSVGIVESLASKETVQISHDGQQLQPGRRALHELPRRPRPEGLGQGQHQPRRDADLDPPLDRRPGPRVPAPGRRHRGPRLRQLLRQPGLGPRGQGRLQPGERRSRGHRRAADESGPLLPAPGRDLPEAGSHRDLVVRTRRLRQPGSVPHQQVADRGLGPVGLARARAERPRLSAPGRRDPERAHGRVRGSGPARGHPPVECLRAPSKTAGTSGDDRRTA